MNKKVVIFIIVLASILAHVLLWRAMGGRAGEDFQNSSDSTALRYLPLGDSYTIGQSVTESERWPNQFAAQYKPDGKNLQIVSNPARTGYTSQDLIDHELPLVESSQADFITIQIGVNDYVRGVSVESFEDNLEIIVAECLEYVTNSNIVIVTIPDFGKTATGSSFGDPQDIANGILKFNAAIKRVAQKNSIVVVDIFSISQQVSENTALTADDGLHPSGEQYSLWVNEVINEIQE